MRDGAGDQRVEADTEQGTAEDRGGGVAHADEQHDPDDPEQRADECVRTDAP